MKDLSSRVTVFGDEVIKGNKMMPLGWALI